MGRLLAIDYGMRRVGIAVTDTLQIIASGLTTVANKDVEAFLKKYLKEEEVDEIILGYPLGLDNQPTDLTHEVAAFNIKLNEWFPTVPIRLVDERFTSKMAKATLISSGVPKKKRRNKALLDEISATIILQEYLYNQ